MRICPMLRRPRTQVHETLESSPLADGMSRTHCCRVSLFGFGLALPPIEVPLLPTELRKRTPRGFPLVSREELIVRSLGPCRVDSPMLPLLDQRKRSYYNVDESDRVLFDDTASALLARGVPADQIPGFEPAGPRRQDLLRPVEDPRRHRHLRRAVPRLQRRDPRPRDGVALPLRRPPHLRVLQRLPGVHPEVQAAGARTHPAVGQPDQRARRHHPRHVPRASKTRSRSSTAWSGWA